MLQPADSRVLAWQDFAEISRRMYEEMRSPSRDPRDHVEDG